MVWLSGFLPYQQCQLVFARIGQVSLPATSIWRQTQRYGEQLAEYLSDELAQVSIERVALPDERLDHDQQKGVSMDGGMVNIRGEGWKEFKCGVVFDVEQRLAQDAETKEWGERPHAVGMTYTAVLGSVEQFAPAIWKLAVDHAIPTAQDSSVTADGAEWIWNLSADYFPASAEIVDWYHAVERLANAARACFPDDDAQMQRWFKTMRNHLFYGQISHITQDLDDRQLSEHARYFHVHRHRMRYHEFQEAGYPIGSGTVESGIKQFKARLTGAGMRWNRPAAQQMLVLRAAVLGDTFDALWDAAAA